MTHSEARKINAMRWIKRIMIDLDESIAKDKRPARTYQMLSIKDVLKAK
jgi:hypothetical protein